MNTSRPARRYSLALGLLGGAALDALIPDPLHGHPVAGFGRVAAALEHQIWADSRIRGAAFTAACVGTSVVAAAVVQRRSHALRPFLVAGTTWAVLGSRSLRSEAHAVGRLLNAADLPAARERLTHLVGRDPANLDADEVSRAVVESVAENTCDAVVAPLFWGAVAGLPGLVGYRAINTLDAMVGHRSARYENFGWASARLDDVANLVPARLTAALVAATAPLVGGRPTTVLRIVRRDGRRHPSPNSGMCEAAYAAALSRRLGGRNVYEGRIDDRPEMGDGGPVAVADIARARRLCVAVTAAAAVVAAALALGSRRSR